MVVTARSIAVDRTLGKPNRLPRSFRMIKSADFGAVLSIPRDQTIRAFSDFFTVTVVKTPHVGVVRFGLTVGKKNAPLSVDRALVKRLLRESSRKKRLAILDFFPDSDFGLDISLRLKGKLPCCGAQGITKQARRVLLRNDIEKLYAFLFKKLSFVKGEWCSVRTTN